MVLQRYLLKLACQPANPSLSQPEAAVQALKLPSQSEPLAERLTELTS